MLRWSESCACWFVTACATFAALRFKFSAIRPNSSSLSNSARARASPATRRSENFASSPTGLSTRLLSTNIDEQSGGDRQAERGEQRSAGASRQRRRVEQRQPARLLARVVREPENSE